jgi:hypothetical protein
MLTNRSGIHVISILLAISLISLCQNILSYGENESNRITQPQQNTSSTELGEPEKITTTGGTEEKIRCPNGSLANTGPECSSSQECPAEPSENLTTKCVQPSQRNSTNTNATNMSSVTNSS